MACAALSATGPVLAGSHPSLSPSMAGARIPPCPGPIIAPTVHGSACLRPFILSLTHTTKHARTSRRAPFHWNMQPKKFRRLERANSSATSLVGGVDRFNGKELLPRQPPDLPEILRNWTCPRSVPVRRRTARLLAGSQSSALAIHGRHSGRNPYAGPQSNADVHDRRTLILSSPASKTRSHFNPRQAPLEHQLHKVPPTATRSPFGNIASRR